ARTPGSQVDGTPPTARPRASTARGRADGDVASAAAREARKGRSQGAAIASPKHAVRPEAPATHRARPAGLAARPTGGGAPRGSRQLAPLPAGRARLRPAPEQPAAAAPA